MIGVPSSFLQSDRTEAPDEVEAQADWAAYLNRWVRSVDHEVKIVVVPIEQLMSVVDLQPSPRQCVAVFRRSEAEALRYDKDCVVGPDIYDLATRWMRGEQPASLLEHGLTPTLLHRRSDRTRQVCATSPKLTGECFVVHGRLTIGNGPPAARIWPVGTKRLLGVVDANGEDREGGRDLPANLSKLMVDVPFDTALFVDFNVCPLTESRPGWMQMVCVVGANQKALVARPISLRNARSIVEAPYASLADHSLAVTDDALADERARRFIMEEERHTIAASHGQVRREGNLLMLRLRRGMMVKLHNDSCIDEDGGDDVQHCSRYYFAAHLHERRGFLILVTYYENTAFEWIDDLTGAITTIADAPYFSPAGERFVVARNAALGYGGIQVWRRLAGKFVLEWEHQNDEFGYSVRQWHGKNEVLLNRSRWVGNELVKVPVKLVKSASEWRLIAPVGSGPEDVRFPGQH